MTLQDLELLGGEYEYNLVTKQFDAEMQSFTAQKAAALDAKVQELVIEDAKGQLNSRKLNIEDINLMVIFKAMSLLKFITCTRTFP